MVSFVHGDKLQLCVLACLLLSGLWSGHCLVFSDHGDGAAYGCQLVKLQKGL